MHDCLVDLGELDEAQAVLLQRLVVLVELSHEQSELVVIGLDLSRKGRRAEKGYSGCDCLHH